MNEQHVEDLLDLYVLGALEPDEERTVEHHITDCDHCRRLLDESRSVVAGLALTPQQYMPPPYLGSKVMRHIEQLQRAEQAPPTAPQPVGPRGFRLPSWLRMPPTLRTAALVGLLVVLLVLGRWNLDLRRQLSSLQQEVASTEVLRANNPRVIYLAPQPAAPEAHANMVIDPYGTSAVFIAEGLPPLPEGKDYQLWLAEGDQAGISAAIFRGNEYGNAKVFIETPKLLEMYTSCGVTIEPTGGSPQPTGERVLRSEQW